MQAPEILEGNSASEVMTQTIVVLGGLLCAVGASDVRIVSTVPVAHYCACVTQRPDPFGLSLHMCKYLPV